MIDCDVHQNFTSIKEFFPYLSEYYQDLITRAGYAGLTFPSYPWFHPEGFTRRDAVPPDGGPPGSNYEMMRQQLLDGYNIDYAILTGEEILTVSAMPSPHVAAALCSAYNDWLIQNWLSRDRRLKGSLAVPVQDPERAAAEIRRVGGHQDIVQVLLPSGARVGYGHPQYHPIFEAASELGLVIGIHVGADGCGTMGAPTATGWPTYYMEYHTMLCTSHMSHVTSLICHGVFEKFPQLRVALIEGSVCWLPGLLWRMDNNYKALRMEVPWLKKLPSEYAREHLRLTTQPLEQPSNRKHLRDMIEIIGTEMLMFATDYPHWDFDNPAYMPVKDERIMDGNAREWYRLPARVPNPVPTQV